MGFKAEARVIDGESELARARKSEASRHRPAFARQECSRVLRLPPHFRVGWGGTREEPRFEPSEALATELEECEDDIEIRESVIAVCDEQFPTSKLLKQAKILPDKSPAAKSPAAKSPAATAAN